MRKIKQKISSGKHGVRDVTRRLTLTRPWGKMMARKIIRLYCSLLNFALNHLLDIIVKYSKFQRIRIKFSVWPPYSVILHHMECCVLRLGADGIRAVISDQIVTIGSGYFMQQETLLFGLYDPIVFHRWRCGKILLLV